MKFFTNRGVRFTQGEHYAGLLEPAFRDVMEAVNRHAMTRNNFV